MTHQTHVPNLETAAIGNPITRLGVSFFPIYMMGSELPEIATGQDSGLIIDELDDASVPTLSANNPTDKPILIVEGQHFLGGKQNRAVNATILIASGSKLEIPVSCLEQGRWGRREAYRQAETFTPRRIRRRQQEAVNQSMRYSGSRQGDQGAVWSAVDEVLGDSQMDSPTSAAADIDNVYRRERPRAEAVEELTGRGPLPGQSGIAVTHGRWVVAIELFGSPKLLAAHWSGVIRSHLLEQPKVVGRPSPTGVLSLIKRFGSLRAENTPGVGLGIEQRVQDKRIVGQALTLDGAVVHGSAFARAPGGQEGIDGGTCVY